MMTRWKSQWTGGLVTMLWGLVLVAAAYSAPTMTPQLKGKYILLKDEPSIHTPGKVKLIEFADFYCPHCHMFEQQILPLVKQEFGDRLEVVFVGFPIIPGKIPTPFDMYEQAKTMGKGPQMKQILFRTIHKDRMQILDRTIRESLIKEVGLDPAAFEAGMASGKPARAVEDSKKWGQRVQVDHTPTLILDGNIKLETVDPDNLKVVIKSILEADAKQ
jgi:protein dithiol oxidoreductase (disulfide-forming)